MKRGLHAIVLGVFALIAPAMEARDRAVRPLQVEAGFNITIDLGSNVINPPPGLMITYTVSGAPAGVTVTLTPPVVTAPFPNILLTIATDAATIPGHYVLTITGVTNIPWNPVAPIFLGFDVLPAQFNKPAVTPSALTFVAGSASTFAASANVRPHYPSTITVTPMPPPNVIISPAQAVIAPSNSTTPTVGFTVMSSVPGTTTVPVEFRSSSGQQQVVPLTVTVTAPPLTDFAIAVTPPVVSLSAGETRQLMLTIVQASASIPIPLVSQGLPPPPADVVVTVTPGNGVTVTPSQFTARPPATLALTVAVSPEVSGIVPINISAVSGANRHTARADVAILPAINAVVPPSVVAPSISTIVRISGTNFAPGGTVISNSPGVLIERTIVYSPTLAEAVISVRQGTPIGALRLDFRNPEGGASARGATLFVYPQEAIGAPLGVSTAAIVFPVEGTIVGSSQHVYPRALLATSGTGTVTGHWAIDGNPFDQFVATTSAGAPLEIRARSPIPPTAIGRHELSLVIESPNLTEAPAVAIESAAASLPPITIYEPLDRAIVEGALRVRWTIVPGASGYEVEFRQLDGERRELTPRRVRITASEWTPNEFPPGMYKMRVRPIFPIDVRGEPTEWTTAVILPSKATIRLDQPSERRVSWSGGAAGMLYRLEFLGSAGRCFDALTFASEYRLPDSLPWRDCSSVRVRALAPSGTVLGISDARPLSPEFASATSVARDTPLPEVVERYPSSGAASAAVGVRWRGPSGDDAVLIVDGVDVTSISARQRQGIEYQPLLPLREGMHVAALVSGGRSDEWTFGIAENPPAPAATPPASPKYVLRPNGSVIWSRSEPGKESREEHLLLASEGEAGDATTANGTKAKADLGWIGSVDPHRLVQESRNWVGEGRRTVGPVFGSARFGYTVPDFTDGTTFLNSGVARTGIVARTGSAYGTLSYYQPVDPAIHGVISASPDELKIRSFAVATPDGKPYAVRVIGLHVDEPANAIAGTLGSSMRTYGLLAGYTLGTTAAFVLETARGTLDSPAGGRKGSATRFGVSGIIAGAAYSLNLREIDPNFVNPASRGLTNGIADRQAADFSITRTFGKNVLGVTACREDQGRASGSLLPHASSSKGGLTLATTLSARFGLTASVAASHATADVAAGSTLPRTDQMQTSASATLSETFSRLNLAQTLDWSRHDDRVEPLSDQKVNALTIVASGGVVPHVTLTSSANYTRTIGAPLVGTTNSWLVTISPSVSVPMLLLDVQPTVAINATSNDVVHTNMRTESYGTILQWSPAWFASLLSGQVSGAVTRTSNAAAALPATRTTARQYRASVTLHLNKSRGLPMFAALPPPPGNAPASAPEQPGSGPVQAAPPAAASETKPAGQGAPTM